MALVAWPDRLPAPMAAGYSYQPQAPFIRTNMDNGLARQRRRFISIPTQVSVTWTLSQEQLALFEAFVHYDLLDGVCWFSAVVFSGMERQNVKARMISAYKIDNIEPGVWKASVTLETINMPVSTPDQYVALRDFGEDVMHSTSSDLHSLIHVDLPGALVW
ncbi:hypothetical protein [Burkholderia vietnamiensis]|uniref:hypothetical protein n=1 Tax=Burkholderia vietnamiensis TaxID=60552 RepID=UPI001B9DFEC9|nr:hypothetical protein [Burkholderia vietnamiensis]MBR8084566.1 hypothetical protein [Burkholderia vietnamiensis]MCA8198352.1 hypothetical protein [Burkholderia vietnamiensis]